MALLGDRLVVGARFEDSAATGVDGDQGSFAAEQSGAVYVFRRTGTTWQQEAYLKPSDTEEGHNFGVSVVLTEDTIAVGASLRFPGGAVYVFRRAGETWVEEAILEGAEVSHYDEFGASLALVGDTLVVGASGPYDEAGAAYVFQRTGTTWAQEATLQAPSPGPGDDFGGSLALAGDTLFVGARGDGDIGGAVHVFRRAGAWQHEAELEPLDSAPGDSFGTSLAVSDGALAAGAATRDAGDVQRSGALYLFDAQ